MFAIPVDETIFPRFVSDTEDDREPAHKTAPRPGRPLSPDVVTILVVDDDLANLALAEAVLQADGFQVCVAMNAASTFEVLKTCKPSLISAAAYPSMRWAARFQDVMRPSRSLQMIASSAESTTDAA